MEINRQRRHGGSLCLSIADIDHFKKINDGHGHAVGDEVLVQFGELLCLQMRPTDTAARIGGEEFVVLMPHTKIGEALATAERLRSAMVERTFGALEESITVSIGLSAWRDGEAFAQPLHRADAALLEAKRKGRDRVLCGE